MESSKESRLSSLKSAAPSRPARILSFIAILISGACGGLVGYTVTDLQCSGDCVALSGSIGLAGAGLAAGGVGIVCVLTLRAMTEWKTNEQQQSLRDRYPVEEL